MYYASLTLLFRVPTSIPSGSTNYFDFGDL